QAAATINSSLDSGALETTILGEAARLTGAGAAALLVPRGDVLVAREALGIGDRARDSFVVPLETSVYGRALVSGEIVVAGLGEPEAGDQTPTPAWRPPDGPWRAVMVAPLQSHRAAYGVLALLFADARPCGDEERAVVRTLAIHAAIALDNRRLMREKEHMAVRDGLTDVFNRGYLELALERTVKDVRRNGGDVSILFVDVDGMKDVNDTHGHHAGDVLLIELAHLLRDSCRETDVVARYGGDEFVVLMPATGAAGAAAVERKVEAAIAARNAAATAPPYLSASTGTHTATAEGVDTLLQEADRRMYAVKRARGGRGGSPD
ncbi:MAG: GGDEF domain-containing protein, partial [Deltaproteobacteria bacterium]